MLQENIKDDSHMVEYLDIDSEYQFFPSNFAFKAK